MALLDIWKKNAAELSAKSLPQLLGLAGDGRLRDESATSLELREFLAAVPSNLLKRYADDCLEASKAFNESGLALQDLVNQVGRRLGFQVQHGRYRASSKAIGYDGIWRTRQGEAIVVEVKTSDAYRMSLDTAADYRRRLIAEKAMDEDKSSILYVVGRHDTGDLEAQVRGSRHAWDIRLISVDALFSLLRIKEEIEDPNTVDKIRDILMPREFTRVDGIIDLVFSATKEARKDVIETPLLEPAKAKAASPSAPSFRDSCVAKLTKHLGRHFVRSSPAIFVTSDEKAALMCATSREYESGKNAGYWFAFHPGQKATLSGYEEAWVTFGCGSAKHILLFPLKEFIPLLEQMHVTDDDTRFYWHIRAKETNGKWALHTKAGYSHIDVSKYLLK